MFCYSQSNRCEYHPEDGKLIKCPIQYFSLIFQETLYLESLSERRHCFLDHTEVLLYGSYGGACHSFHLFSHGNCNSVHLSWISHIHYRTMLVVIPFFSLLQSEKKKLASFDQNWF